MRVPTEISGSAFNELRCMGRVVHQQETRDGKHGYGVKIEAMAPRDLLREPEAMTEGSLRGAV